MERRRPIWIEPVCWLGGWVARSQIMEQRYPMFEFSHMVALRRKYHKADGVTPDSNCPTPFGVGDECVKRAKDDVCVMGWLGADCEVPLDAMVGAFDRAAMEHRGQQPQPPNHPATHPQTQLNHHYQPHTPGPRDPLFGPSINRRKHALAFGIDVCRWRHSVRPHICDPSLPPILLSLAIAVCCRLRPHFRVRLDAVARVACVESLRSRFFGRSVAHAGAAHFVVIPDNIAALLNTFGVDKADVPLLVLVDSSDRRSVPTLTLTLALTCG